MKKKILICYLFIFSFSVSANTDYLRKWILKIPDIIDVAQADHLIYFKLVTNMGEVNYGINLIENIKNNKIKAESIRQLLSSNYLKYYLNQQTAGRILENILDLKDSVKRLYYLKNLGILCTKNHLHILAKTIAKKILKNTKLSKKDCTFKSYFYSYAYKILKLSKWKNESQKVKSIMNNYYDECYEKIPDNLESKKNIFKVFVNIAERHFELKEYKQAQEYYFKAIKNMWDYSEDMIFTYSRYQERLINIAEKYHEMNNDKVAKEVVMAFYSKGIEKLKQNNNKSEYYLKSLIEFTDSSTSVHKIKLVLSPFIKELTTLNKEVENKNLKNKFNILICKLKILSGIYSEIFADTKFLDPISRDDCLYFCNQIMILNNHLNNIDEILKNIKSNVLKSNLYYKMGMNYLKKGKYNKSHNMAKKSLEEMSNPQKKGTYYFVWNGVSWLDISNLFTKLNHANDVYTVLKRLRETEKDKKFIEWMSSRIQRILILYLLKKDDLVRATKIYNQIESKEYQLLSLLNFGLYYLDNKNRTEGFKYLNRAYEFLQKNITKIDTADFFLELEKMTN